MLSFGKKSFLITCILILAVFFFYNTLNFKLDASSDTLILQNDKDFEFYKYYNEIFPNKSFLVLAIKSENKIDQNYINYIKKIKNELSEIEYVESIFAITDAPILISSNLSLNDLSVKTIPTIDNSKIELSKILNEFSESPLFKEQIISKNKKVSALIIYPKTNEKFYQLKKQKEIIFKKNSNYSLKEKEIINQYRIAKKQFNTNRHNLIVQIRSDLNKLNIPYEYSLGGIDMIADDTISFVKKDIIIFGIFVTLFLIVILFIIFRNVKWVIIPLITTFYSILTMTGLIGFFNWEITAISANFISLMLILSISMNIHIINRYRINYSNENNIGNLKSTMLHMFFPCLYTALTTIVAFGSLLFSDIKPVIDFGKVMIVALIIIFISSFTILPLVISLFPKINKDFKLKWKINDLFYKISINKSFTVILINILFFVISLWGIKSLNVENSFINYFKKDSEIHKGMKLIDEELGGTTPLDIVFKFKKDELGNPQSLIESDDDNFEIEIQLDNDFLSNLETSSQDSFFNKEKLNTIRSIHKYLENKNEIGKVQSIYSLIQVAESINREPLDSFTLNIIHKEMPDEYKELLIKPFLSIKNNMVKINSRVLDSKEIVRNKLINEIRAELSDKYENIEEIKVNGLLVLYNNMLQSLFSSQVKSFGIVLILIFIMFIILFKSIKLSIAGILPNIFASTFILGVIGILKIPLDIMTITVAAITIGIAVDNSIHYLYNVKNNILTKKKSISESLKNSHTTVGQAVFTTSITIAFGFSVLSLSNFIPTILFGLFTALAMIAAMIGVLITLPSILKHINIKTYD